MNTNTISKISIFVYCLLITINISAQEIVSPNKNIKVVLSENPYGQVFFNIKYKRDSRYIEVLPDSPLGITRKDQQFADSLRLIKISGARQIHDKYQMIAGKRKNCENFGTEKVFSYKNSDGEPLDIIFRAYNDGAAFRYIFPDHSDSLVSITSEATTYVLPDSTYRWMQPYNEVYEDFYNFSKTGISKRKSRNGDYRHC